MTCAHPVMPGITRCACDNPNRFSKLAKIVGRSVAVPRCSCRRKHVQQLRKLVETVTRNRRPIIVTRSSSGLAQTYLLSLSAATIIVRNLYRNGLPHQIPDAAVLVRRRPIPAAIQTDAGCL